MTRYDVGIDLSMLRIKKYAVRRPTVMLAMDHLGEAIWI